MLVVVSIKRFVNKTQRQFWIFDFGFWIDLKLTYVSRTLAASNSGSKSKIQNQLCARIEPSDIF